MMRCDFRHAGIANARDRLTEVDDAVVAEQVDSVFNVLSEDDRTLTAEALAATQAEVCALQEVENLVTLTAFDTRYLSRWEAPYSERVLLEGNDSRGIDVGILSRLPVSFFRSHARETYGSLGLRPPPRLSVNDYAFRRDCLEADIVKDGRVLTVFVCHFKSMHGGRRHTRLVRQAEARAVRLLIERRFEEPAKEDWIVLGDFNDYFELDGKHLRDHALGPLVDDDFSVDLVTHAIANPYDRWTHHYSGDDTYGALDHMFLSPALAAKNPRPEATIIRGGTPYRAQRYEGLRFPGVGWAEPKASDHCPLAASLRFEGRPLVP
ncbi:MAG: endonuclease/exonuclease/phosphatase family protein [Hyphomonas sp.]|nr:endonuclease/exonuclease/phosphatase family protein [Hyphomonas sp.]